MNEDLKLKKKGRCNRAKAPMKEERKKQVRITPS